MKLSLIALIMSTTFLSGCGTFKVFEPAYTKTYEVQSAVQLADVKLSVSEPILWSEVAEEYKPKFNIASATKLLDKVAPRVGGDYYSNSLRQSVQAELAYQGLQINNDTTSTSNVETENDEETSNTNSSETTNQITKKTPDSPSSSTSAPSSSLTYTKPTEAYSYDPFAQYNAATALYQRIKTLDTYLDASYDTDDQVAFLMHVKITPSVFSNNQPYDLYSTLRFGKVDGDNTSTIKGYKIFPLIVSDNLERIPSERKKQRTNELLLKLAGSGGQVGGAASVNRILEELQVLHGDDVTNLLTLSQGSEKDLTVMIGAGFDPDSRYALRDRSVDVSFVVAIDREVIAEGVNYQLILDNQFRNTMTGKLLPFMVDEDIERYTDLYYESRAVGSESCPDDKGIIKEYIQKYLRDYKYTKIPCWTYDRALYLELLYARSQALSDAHIVTFGPFITKDPIKQTAVFTDDKKALVVTVAASKNTDITFLNAALSIGTDKPEIFIHRSVSKKEREISIVFPSLLALGYDLSKNIPELLLTLSKGGTQQSYDMKLQPDAGSKPKATRKASFLLSKIDEGFSGDSKTQLNAILVLNPVKTLANDIKKLKLTVTGGVLDNVMAIDKARKKIDLIGAEPNVGSNSFTFSRGKEDAYRITLENKGPQIKPITILVQGLNDKGKLISVESQSIVYE